MSSAMKQLETTVDQQKLASKAQPKRKAYSAYENDQHARNGKNIRCKTQADFNKIAQQMIKNSLGYHDSQACLCQYCHCGRHYCKLQVPKPNLSKSTTYQRSFKNTTAINNVVPHSQEYQRLKGPYLNLKSTYQNGFDEKQGIQVEILRPKDSIQSNGLVSNITSYGSQFIGHKGMNQYIKPTNKHLLGQFPLKSKSMYKTQFKPKNHKKKESLLRPTDQMKSGQKWLGKSTYQNFYSSPNPEYLAKKVKVIEKREQQPNYIYQYKTTYKSDFVKQTAQNCPSKIHLQTKGKGQFSEIKDKFKENADFKTMSLNYHAFSTSYF